MNVLSLLCYLAALVLFVLAAAGPPPPFEPWRTRLLSAGLAFWLAGQHIVPLL